MQRKFLSSLGLILLLNLIVKPFYLLGIDAEVQIRVGKDAYGLYFGLLNLSFILNMFIDLGINNFNNRNISQNIQLVSKHFTKLFTIKAYLAFGYALLTLGLGLALGYGQESFEILALLTLNQVLVSFILFGRSNLAALHLFSRDSIISVLDRALLIAFCSIFLFTNFTDQEFKIEWFVYLQTLAYVITLLVSIFMLRGNIGRLKFKFDKLFAIQIFKKSIPYATFTLIAGLYNRLDGIMLEKIGPEGSFTAGEYAQGFRFFEAASMFAYLFAVLLLPIYSRMLKEGSPIKPMVDTATRLLLGSSLAVAILFYFHGDFVLEWRYPDVTESSAQAFSALMIGFVGVGMFYVYGTLMTADEDLKKLNYISIGGLVLNVLLNFYLIPIHGAFGAAIATMATQLFAGVAQLFSVVIRFKFGVNTRLLLQFILYGILAVGTNLFLEDFIPENAFYRFLVSALVGGVLLLVTGLFSVNKFVRLLKSNE
ncbi:polysaccharide biosynthesis C-terminal domain-containing protein [Cryomorphaceae bacterium 1068]|nr:polysaccharide biosynthesis C-terminal domain-containing protein [Cryomorphaceae bacterium 1068]